MAAEEEHHGQDQEEVIKFQRAVKLQAEQRGTRDVLDAEGAAGQALPVEGRDADDFGGAEGDDREIDAFEAECRDADDERRDGSEDAGQ